MWLLQFTSCEITVRDIETHGWPDAPPIWVLPLHDLAGGSLSARIFCRRDLADELQTFFDLNSIEYIDPDEYGFDSDAALRLMS